MRPASRRSGKGYIPTQRTSAQEGSRLSPARKQSYMQTSAAWHNNGWQPGRHTHPSGSRHRGRGSQPIIIRKMHVALTMDTLDRARGSDRQDPVLPPQTSLVGRPCSPLGEGSKEALESGGSRSELAGEVPDGEPSAESVAHARAPVEASGSLVTSCSESLSEQKARNSCKLSDANHSKTLAKITD